VGNVRESPQKAQLVACGGEMAQANDEKRRWVQQPGEPSNVMGARPQSGRCKRCWAAMFAGKSWVETIIWEGGNEGAVGVQPGNG